VIDFRSDNTSPPAAIVLQRLEDALAKGASVYADDEITQATQRKLGEIFERELHFFPVFTGTAANALAIAQLTGRFGEVLCDSNSHIFVDECGAVEFQSQSRLHAIPSREGKLHADQLPRLTDSGDVHRGKPTVLSVSQTTETGLVYQPDELAALTSKARKAGMRIHMDGTRFANAVASTGASPADLSWRAGVDALCLGATKGGAIGAESVIFFSAADASEFRRLMKRSGHLGARMWFLSAQMEAWLHDDYWLRSARYGNEMASVFSHILQEAGIETLYPVEANMIFVEMSAQQSHTLNKMGFLHYYIEQPNGCFAARFVTSHGTQISQVEQITQAIKECVFN